VLTRAVVETGQNGVLTDVKRLVNGHGDGKHAGEVDYVSKMDTVVNGTAWA